jgi:hypothetical protein
MGKFRWVGVIIFVFFFQGYAYSQDTLTRRGFKNYKEAADTIWSRLSYKKPLSMLQYTINDSVFLTQVRLRGDTVTPSQFVHGQWTAYYYKVEKSFSKTWKELHKKKINLKRSEKDTILIYKDPEQPTQERVEVYFKRGKLKGMIRFQLWKVGEAWYLLGKIEYNEEKGRIR